MKNTKDGSGASAKPQKTSKKLTSDEILSFIKENNGRASKAEIARQFGIKGNDRIGLKHVLKEMMNRGTLYQGSFRSFTLPPVIAPGEKRLTEAEKERYPRRAARELERDRASVSQRNYQNEEAHSAPISFIGLYEPMKHGNALVNPISRKDKHPIVVAEGYTKGARNGDLVRAIYHPRGWQIEEVLAEPDDAGMVSLMAIKSLDIPHEFPHDVIAQTEGMTVPELGKRTDLRALPLVTIDGEDARDFDDAVHAEANDDGGWTITVAIADVSHYVTPGSPLDKEAYKRGNSVYFPDRVVPMLPEALSNDLCSLRPDETRACMVAIMRINDKGNLIDKQVVRALMKSQARLTYTEVQEAIDGQPNEKTKPILDTLIKPLYGAYQTLAKARAERGTVELDLPERKVQLKNGEVQDIVSRPRYDSHKLIEEMMILANVAVAELLQKKRQPALYRLHAKPDASRWETTRDFLKELGLKTKSSLQPEPRDLQALLEAVEGRDEAQLVNDMVLRSMSQAAYGPENIGHFGLALESYAHFTSPIRRYADLIVHRALIRAFDLGDDGLTDYETNRLTITGEHISARERVAQMAERETIDRYIALFLEDKVGATFHARISGVTRFGLFVNVSPMGADGLIPVRSLPDDYYIHDEKRHSLVGRRRGLSFRLAMPLTVRLLEVEAATGRLLMEILPGSIQVPENNSERKFERKHQHVIHGRRERDGSVRTNRGKDSGDRDSRPPSRGKPRGRR